MAELRIVKTSGGCKVIPPYGSLSPNEQVTWKNRTGKAAVLCFPHDNVLLDALASAGGNPVASFTHRIPPGQDFILFAPPQGSAYAANNFPFAVYCVATGGFAQGNSDPGIIIEA